MKIVLNKCYGGFGVSTEVFKYLIEKKNWVVGENGKICESDALGERYYFNYDMAGISICHCSNIEFRSNPDLVDAIEHIGVDKASGACSKLEIVYVPDWKEIELEITDYDGLEKLQEVSKCWG